MKRITFLALATVLLSIGAAKAQVGVHVGLNFGTPVYHHVYNRPVYVAPAPAYYPPVYEPAYYPTYYRRPVYVRRAYYSRPVVVYHTRYYNRPYRRW